MLDVLKRRVAHYSPHGRYLGEFTGLPLGPNLPIPRDLTVIGDRVFVAEQDRQTGAAFVQTFGSGGTTRTPVLYRGAPATIVYLAAGTSGLVGWLGGYAETGGRDLGSGPRGWGALNVPGSGALTLLPGLPLPDGIWTSLDTGTGQDLEVTFAGSSASAIQPLLIRLVGSPGGVALSALVGPQVAAALPHGLAAVVMIQPSEPADAARFGGGRWFLRISSDGSPLAWERLPSPGLSDEVVVRALTAGPDGSAYLMLPERNGLKILRRS